MSARVRECRACDGTGEAEACERQHGLSTCQEHNCCDCEQTWDDVRMNGWSCLACEGRGTQVERIPASDAVADAEQLATGVWMREMWHTAEAGAIAEAVRNVRDHWRSTDLGLYITRCMHTIYDSNVSLYAMETKRIGSELARAAFRAVPGLRG